MNKVKQPKAPPSFAALVQIYFADYLPQQRALSRQTIAAYRDTFMLFLNFAEKRLAKSPTAISLTDMTPALIMAFLDYLERQRHNSVRSRNARLAALRSFLKFAAHRDVSSLAVIERALGVPVKRFERPMIGYLSREEMLAVIDAPDQSWVGQRDHVLFLLLYNTGARVSELIGVKVGEVVLDESAACVHLHGKGRKQRSVPLWRTTVKTIRAWLKLNRQFDAVSPLLPARNGNVMTRSTAAKRLELAAKIATKICPRLSKQRVSPHTIRHTTAMHLLQSGVDISVIALWLGHESPATTHCYVEADLAMKERALAKLHEPNAKMQRYKSPDSLIDFLNTL
jgi:site-specific recombinase XerD